MLQEVSVHKFATAEIRCAGYPQSWRREWPVVLHRERLLPSLSEEAETEHSSDEFQGCARAPLQALPQVPSPFTTQAAARPTSTRVPRSPLQCTCGTRPGSLPRARLPIPHRRQPVLRGLLQELQWRSGTERKPKTTKGRFSCTHGEQKKPHRRSHARRSAAAISSEERHHSLYAWEGWRIRSYMFSLQSVLFSSRRSANKLGAPLHIVLRRGPCQARASDQDPRRDAGVTGP